MDAEGFGATQADVERRLREDFPPSTHEQVREVLHGIALSPDDRPPDPRVLMAVLILAEGDWSRLRQLAAQAAADYRDVLAAAFHPDD